VQCECTGASIWGRRVGGRTRSSLPLPIEGRPLLWESTWHALGMRVLGFVRALRRWRDRREERDAAIARQGRKSIVWGMVVGLEYKDWGFWKGR